MTIHVVKRDGRKEPIDVERIHKVLYWACEGLSGVSVSEVEIASQIQFYNNITTKDIHETLIKAAANLINEDSPNYQYVAGRLINYRLRKEVFGRYNPIGLKQHYDNVASIGFYDAQLDSLYTADDWDALDSYIDHNRDDNFAYAGMEQFRGKYLVRNRVTGEMYETPQFAFMLIAMTLFSSYKENRLSWVKKFYDAVSNFDISLPTPIMAGVRTPQRQYSSCTLIDSDDSLDSIIATTGAIVKYAANKAGIGINGGRIRALKSAIRNGDTAHTGVIPFWRLWQDAVLSCSQGGVRKGSATLNYPFWHLEVEDLLVLKNNKGTDETRLRNIDYCVQFNKLMYERLITGGNITLFSPNDVPDLYDAFFADKAKFTQLYEKYERSTKIRKKTIPAQTLFADFMQERKDTGRIYFMNVDHCNEHGSYLPEVAPIRMTNLCVEVTQCTKPLTHINDEESEIALCTLGAINWGKIKTPSDLSAPCEVLVRALDALLDYQEYSVIAAKNHTMKRRPIGVGVINYAYWLAKNDTNYTSTNLDMVHEYAEAWSYYLINASVNLAEEFGPCPAWDETKYGQGILPIDTYKSDVDTLVEPNYKMDWHSLRERLKKFKIRNSTLMCGMPSETSSQISNATNGFEPPRSIVSSKGSKDGILPQVVPESKKLSKQYELLWDQKSPIGYLKNMAVMQKFMDQSISTNFSYNPIFFEDNKVPMSVLLQDMLWAYKYGIKTGYYLNTNDQAGEEDVSDSCESCTI